MKAQNNFKPWTLEEVRTVINYPKTWAWAKALSRELGRSSAATAYINTAFNAWTKGNHKYTTTTLDRYFRIITNPKGNAQIAHNYESTPAAKDLVEKIEAEMSVIQALFLRLGDAIVREKYAAVNKELETQKTHIQELEAQIKEMEQKGKFDIKSYFNIS